MKFVYKAFRFGGIKVTLGIRLRNDNNVLNEIYEHLYKNAIRKFECGEKSNKLEEYKLN